MKAMVKNAADEQQIKEAELRQKFTREDEVEDFRQVLQTPSGRRLLWRVLTECRIFQTILPGPASETHFLEGRRDVGLWILDEITESDPDSLIEMMKQLKGEKENGRSNRKQYQQRN